MSNLARAEGREPLIHLSKRAGISRGKAWSIRIIAVLLGILVCGIAAFLLIEKIQNNPEKIGEFYGTFIKGSFSTSRKFWKFLKNTAVLLCISLALTPAFRMRFWNTGGEGQTLVGVLSAIAVNFYLGGKIPEGILLILMLLAALAAGAVWGVIPAIFRAKWGTNETLFTLMMNYVATQLVAYYVIIWEVPKGSGKIGIINQSTEAGWLPVIAGNKYLLNILIVALLTVAMYIYLYYSKHGYEISVVGESEATARYVGIKVGRTIIRTLIISGAICGLTGFLLVAGTDHTLTTTLAGGQGFTAVMVAWLAKFNPIGMVLSSFLLVALSRGAAEISTIFGLNQSFGDILTGIILFFIIGCDFFITYQVHFRKSARKEEKSNV